MNVLFYYDKTMNPVHGGIAQVTLRLGEHLREKGNHIYYLSKNKTSDSLSDWQFYLPGTSVRDDEKFFGDFLQRYEIQIVVNQNGISPRSNEGIVWGHRAKVPVVTVIHNSLYGMYGMNNHLKWLRPLARRLGVLDDIQSVFFKLFKCKYGRYYKQQVELSEWIVLLSEKFVPEYCFFSGMPKSIAANKIRAIPNPVEQSVDKCMPKGKCKEVLYVGRLSPEKQVGLLLDVWARVQQEFAEWRLVIVGDGAERMSLERKVKRRHIKNVSFEGFCKPDEYYKRASLFCMTSAYEGFGMVLAEAMSYGTVPLAFNSFANVTDIIDDGRNGLLVTPFSVDEYAMKLSWLMSNEDKMQRMLAAAIEKSRIFSIEKIGGCWMELFKSIR